MKENPFDTSNLTFDERLRNVAKCVMRHTEVKTEHNGRGRSKTYAVTVDTIANASRQLAEMVLSRYHNTVCNKCGFIWLSLRDDYTDGEWEKFVNRKHYCADCIGDVAADLADKMQLEIDDALYHGRIEQW